MTTTQQQFITAYEELCRKHRMRIAVDMDFSMCVFPLHPTLHEQDLQTWITDLKRSTEELNKL